MISLTLATIFVNFSTSFLLSFLLIISGKKYIKFALFNINVALWSLFYGSSIIVASPEQSLLYYKLTSVALVFIPYLFFNLAVELSDYNLKAIYKRINISVALVMALLMNTPVMITGTKPFMEFRFIPDITIFYYSYHIYYSILVLSGLTMIYKASKNHYKLVFMFHAFCIGFIGGTTTLFPFSGIPVYPILNILVSIYTCSVAYALIKNRLSETASIINNFLIKIGASIILVVFYLLLRVVYNKFILTNDITLRVVFQVLYFVIALELYQVLVEKLDLIRERFGLGLGIVRKKRDILAKINKSLGIIQLNHLSLKITNIIEKDIGVKVKSFYISSGIEATKENGSEFIRYSGEDISERSIKELQEFFIRKTPQLSIKHNEADQNLRSIMREEGFQALVPLIKSDNDNKYLGFLLLKMGSEGGGVFSVADMELLDELVFKVGDALERIRDHLRFLREKEQFHQDQIKTKELQARAIAHEMRSPISAVALQVEESFSKVFSKQKDGGELVLSQDDTKELTSTQKLLEKLTDRANETIDRLLAEARGEKIEVKHSYLSAKEEIDEAILEFGFKSKDYRRKVIVDVKEDFTFKGNESQFLQVLHNSIKNALDLVEKKPDLTVTISTELTQDYNIVHVSDTGPGMPEEVRVRLYKGDMVTDGKEGGTGVGSNVSKQIMVGFGGDIVCISELGKGTKISLLFPKVSQEELTKSTKSEQSAADEQNYDFSSYSFLIVDDNPTVLSASSRLAQRKLKAPTETSDNFAGAIEKLSKNKFDMVLLDIQLNDDAHAGVEIAKQIKSNPNILPANKDAILICISGDNDEDALREGGFHDYLGKIMPNNLLPMVIKWLGESKGKK